MIGTIDGVEWDAGNRSKCQRHGVSIAEIEEVVVGTIHVFPNPAHSQVETRYLAIGQTARGRHVFLAFTLRAYGVRRLLRPISARYMHAREVKHYEAQIAKTDH